MCCLSLFLCNFRSHLACTISRTIHNSLFSLNSVIHEHVKNDVLKHRWVGSEQSFVSMGGLTQVQVDFFNFVADTIRGVGPPDTALCKTSRCLSQWPHSFAMSKSRRSDNWVIAILVGPLIVRNEVATIRPTADGDSLPQGLLDIHQPAPITGHKFSTSWTDRWTHVGWDTVVFYGRLVSNAIAATRPADTAKAVQSLVPGRWKAFPLKKLSHRRGASAHSAWELCKSRRWTAAPVETQSDLFYRIKVLSSSHCAVDRLFPASKGRTV